MSLKHALAAVLAIGAASAAHADPSTKISGKVFADFTYRDNVDDGTGKADNKTGTSLDLKRFYLTVDQTFDEHWAARFRSDIGNEVNGRYDVFVKHAYIEGKTGPELVLRAGAADLPWVPLVEGLYGYRYVENILVDRIKVATSADWGIHLSGKLADGVATYAVSAVNGRGYGDPTRTQAPTVEGRVSVSPVKELTLAIGAQGGKLGQNVVGTPTPRTASRYDALIAFVGGPARVGVTGFLAKNYDKKIVTDVTVPMDKAIGGSAWASVELVSSVSVFGRFDYVQPRKDTASKLKDYYWNAGVQYEPLKVLDIALVYKGEQVKNGTLSVSNGTVGSSIAGEKGMYKEIGIFAQYSF